MLPTWPERSSGQRQHASKVRWASKQPSWGGRPWRTMDPPLKTYMIWARQPQKAYRSLTSDHLSHLLAADAVVELEVGPTVAIPQSPGGHLLHQPQPHGHMTVRLGGTKAQTWLQCGSRWVAVLEREAGPQPPQVPDSAACSAAATACRRLTRSTSHRGPASGRSLSPQGPNIQRTTVQCLPTLL